MIAFISFRFTTETIQMSPSLVTLAGPLRGQTVTLTDEPLTIGREPSNQVHPPDLSLSRRHSVLVTDLDRVTLTDLESVNGTFVNGVPVKMRVLEHGDQIKVGESVFLFVDQNTAVSDGFPVELDDMVRRVTVRLRKEDMLYLQSDQMLDAFPPTPRRARDLHILLRASATLGSLRTSDDLQRTLIGLLFEAVPADRAAILLSENDGADFASIYARGRHADTSVQISRSVVRQVIAEGVAVLSNDAADSDTFRASRSFVAAATRSVLCAPLKIAEQLQGAVYLASSDPSVRLDEDHLQLVIGLAGSRGWRFRMSTTSSGSSGRRTNCAPI